MATIIETDLKEILGTIQGELKAIRNDLTDLKVDMATVKTELGAVKEDVKDLKGRSSAQIWTLIGLIGTVITAIVAAALRLGFFSSQS